MNKFLTETMLKFLAILILFVSFRGHSQEFPVQIVAMSYSHNGEYLVVAYSDGVIQNSVSSRIEVYNTTTKAKLYQLDIDGNYAKKIAFNANDQWFAIDLGSSLLVTDVVSGNVIYSEDMNISSARMFEWHPVNPAYLLSNSAGLLNARLIPNPDLIAGFSADGGRIPDIAWQDSGNWIATDDIQGNIRIWDTNSTSVLKTYLDPNIGPLNSLDWKPNSSILASSHWNDLLVIREISSDQILYQTTIMGIQDVEWSSDGLYLAITNRDGYITILNKNYQLVGQIDGWEGGIAWDTRSNRLTYGVLGAHIQTTIISNSNIDLEQLWRTPTTATSTPTATVTSTPKMTH